MRRFVTTTVACSLIGLLAVGETTAYPPPKNPPKTNGSKPHSPSSGPSKSPSGKTPKVSPPKLPAPKLPATKAPKLPAPKLPATKAPKLPAPKLPATKAPKLPATKAPKLPAPKLPATKAPKLPATKAPKLPAPKLPATKAPKLPAPRPASLLKKLTPERRKQFEQLQKQAKRRAQEARKVAKGGAVKPVGKKSKPAGIPGKTNITKNGLAKDLDALAKTNPKLKATADKLKANKPLSKTDLANLNKAMKNAKDPKTKAALRNAFVAKYGISDNSLTQIIANDKSPPLTPNEKTAVDKYLHGQPLTAADKAVLDNLQDRPPASLAGLKAAFAQMNRDIRDQAQAQALANALANLGGGGGTVLPGGGLLPSGPDGVTPMCPTAWFPNAGSEPAGPDDATPVGSGVACTVTPNTVGGTDGGTDAGTDGGGDTGATADLGSVATRATAPQMTRYLRLANGTDKPVTISLQYYTQNDKGDWEWTPGSPGGDGALTFNLEPGETVDAKDNDWRINASRVRIWAKSDDGKWMEFKDKDLWLVPETTRDGQHGYQADDVQVFNWTVR